MISRIVIELKKQTVIRKVRGLERCYIRRDFIGSHSLRLSLSYSTDKLQHDKNISDFTLPH